MAGGGNARSSIEAEALRRLRPTKAEERRIKGVLNALIEHTARKIDTVIKQRSLDYKIEIRLVGSVAKGTHTRQPDIDIFLMFPPGVEKDELKEVGLEIGHMCLDDGRELYAQHPYVRGRFMGYNVDMVPSYGVSDAGRIISAVDRTPFHTEYVKANLLPEQRDQVRLLKGIAKGLGVYGAEATVKGLSGYLCELLIIHYGTFSSVLREAATKWHAGFVVSGPKERGIGRGGALVFMDPVDPKRNVASAMSTDSLSMFIMGARAYLASPSLKFFFPPPIRPKRMSAIRERANALGLIPSVVVFEITSRLQEEAHDQMSKTARALIAVLERNEFRIPLHAFGYDLDAGIGWIVLGITCHCPLHVHRGPFVWSSNLTDFWDKWGKRGGGDGGRFGVFLKGGRVWTLRPIRGTISDILRRDLDPGSVGKGAVRAFSTGNYQVLSVVHSNRGMWGPLSNLPYSVKKGIRQTLTELLWPHFPWER